MAGRPLGYVRQAIWCYTWQYIKEFGESPTQLEIGSALLISPSSVRTHLATLKVLGYVTFESGVTRSIRVLTEPRGCETSDKFLIGWKMQQGQGPEGFDEK